MKNITIDWQVFFDNNSKGEDMWGHYKTHNGDLYIVIDGASNHEGTKTGGDVAKFIDDKLKKEAKNIVRSNDLKELLRSINDESAKVNEGAFAAIAGLLHRQDTLFAFSAGDVSILAKKPNGKLLQVLPLDLKMDEDEAEKTALNEIGTVINGTEITKENYIQRSQQYMNHGLCNAVGIGDSFYLNERIFNNKDGAVILIASDGITDPFLPLYKEAGKITKSDAEKISKLIESSENAEQAVESLKELIWDTQVVEKRKIKADDRTAIFFYMNTSE
ncbi:MAG: protein phosphatase 2C domain-containing protein [Gammaproteobacteria bacterium]